MIAKIKKHLLFTLLFLPLGAFADIPSTLSFLTPPDGDFSIDLLQRVFGAVGNTLHGNGNQLIGTLVGVFNAFWVAIIGIAVLYVVWNSVISAAQSGEMMGHGKKTVFSVMKIVIGFSLVAPGASGYSLAQNGVLWVVVQGVGLADQVSAKLSSYLKAGGTTYSPKPTMGNDMVIMVPQVATILKAQICMYSLSKALADEKKAQESAVKAEGDADNPGIQNEAGNPGISDVPTAPPSTDTDLIGYSINKDHSITMGLLNDKYKSDDVNSTKYGQECGVIKWEVAASDLLKRTGMNLNKEETEAEMTIAYNYMQQGVTEVFTNLLPVAKSISEVDLNAKDVDSTLNDLATRGSTTMANSTMSYATLLDPLRFKSVGNRKDALSDRLDRFEKGGWFYTPLAVIMPGLSQAPVLGVADTYPPKANVPTALSGEPFSRISEAERNNILSLMGLVDQGDYSIKAISLLQQPSYNSTLNNIDFDKILDLYTDGTDDLGTLFGYIDGVLWLPNKVMDFARDFGTGLIDIGKKFTGGVDWLAGGICGIAKQDCEVFGDGVMDKLNDAQENIFNKMNEAKANMNSIRDMVGAELGYSRKGGMNDALADLSNKAGPLGSIFTAVMTNMIGKGMVNMQATLFDPDMNAFTATIRLGGTMMHESMNAFFRFAKIKVIITLVEGAANMGKDIPYIGKVLQLGGMLAGPVGSFIGFYIAFACIFFIAGVMLYIMFPLTFLFGFAACVLRWVGMVFINVLAAPIFCFNLIRSDGHGEGMIGRGENYLADLARTAVTPAVLTFGAVAFIILYNIAFAIITTMYAEFLPLVLETYRHDVMIAPIFGITLVVFTMVILWIGQTLSALCTSEVVQAVEHAIGQGIQRMSDQNPTEHIRQAVTSGSQQITGAVKQITSNPTGSGGGK